MATTAELKMIGKQYAEANGLKVISNNDVEVAGKTCRILVRGGKLVVEVHTVLADNQVMVRHAKRETFASMILGVDLSMKTEPLFPKLTKEQQEEVDTHVCGYEYITKF